MQITFILFEPQVAENVGAAARALKTQGFSQLRVVNSRQHEAPAAHWVAHGAQEILQQAGHYDSLEQALADQDLVVGTTAKPRGRLRTLLTPEALTDTLRAKAQSAGRVALLFGREDRGLSNAELQHCDLLTRVPLHAPYPSLNLGQAVMLYAYQLGALVRDDLLAAPHESGAPGVTGEWRALRQRVATLLPLLGYAPEDKAHQWALERLARFDDKDVHFLHSLCTALEQRLAEVGSDGKRGSAS